MHKHIPVELHWGIAEDIKVEWSAAKGALMLTGLDGTYGRHLGECPPCRFRVFELSHLQHVISGRA